ncbi:MAG: ComF family protein [Parcubacteria group bacterium]|nr:ComF family protein [Parcubacteria group bacterium]
MPKNKFICSDCLKGLKPTTKFICANCSAKTINGKTCINCKNNCPLDRFFSLYPYDNETVKEIIHAFKYRFIKDLAPTVDKFTSTYISNNDITETLSAVDFIEAVPLTRVRFNWRGYNQSELIAHGISKIINKPLIYSLKRKGLLSVPQAEIKDHIQRTKNVKNLFTCKSQLEIKNKTLLLVDDVYTSGATMQECARVLKDAGAKEVWGFAIARG